MARALSCLFLIILLGSLLFPSLSLAGTYNIGGGKKVTYKGLVPCGKEVIVNGNLQFIPCQFCHFFVMLDGIIDFILFKIIPPIAAILFMAGGVMFIFSGGDPKKINQGKSLMISVLIGIIIIHISWLIVTTFFTFMGISETGPLKELVANPSKWAQIICPIKL